VAVDVSNGDRRLRRRLRLRLGRKARANRLAVASPKSEPKNWPRTGRRRGYDEVHRIARILVSFLGHHRPALEVLGDGRGRRLSAGLAGSGIRNASGPTM
jgi:hypothetical protein